MLRSTDVMMTSDWTPPDYRRRDANAAPLSRGRDAGFAETLSMAYGKLPSAIPDDLLRLLAKLD